MKSLVALFAPASRSLPVRLTAYPMSTTSRPAAPADRDSKRSTQSRFLSALLGALGAMSA